MVIQKCEKLKMDFFCKNWLTIFVSGREKKRAFSCTQSVLAKTFFGTKTMQTRKHYKNRGFSGNWPKPKMTPFFEKGVFDMVEKWVLRTVFLKSCVFFSENTMFIVFSVKHSFSKTKTVCWKKEDLWKIVGCFWTWKMVFWGLFFSGFNVIVVCFLCVCHSFCFFLFVFLEGLRVRWGGPKGHLTWP